MGRKGVKKLVMKNDGGLVLKNKDKQIVWSSGTEGGRDLIPDGATRPVF